MSANQLRLLIERVEYDEAAKKERSESIRDTYNEAKNQGYDAKIMKKIIALRAMTAGDRAEMDAILDSYRNAMGV